MTKRKDAPKPSRTYKRRSGLAHVLPKPNGRPPLYRKEFDEIAHKLTLLMATDEEIADVFGVNVDTLFRWRHAHRGFSEAIARGKLTADAEVGLALKHRALGYSHEAVKIFMPAGATEPVYAPYIEHYPPDTQAASLWLRNRQPGRWKEKHEVTHSAHNEDIIDRVRKMSREERRAWMESVAERARITIEHEEAQAKAVDIEDEKPDEAG